MFFGRHIIVESDHKPFEAIFIMPLYKEVPAVNFAYFTGLTLAQNFLSQPYALKLPFRSYQIAFVLMIHFILYNIIYTFYPNHHKNKLFLLIPKYIPILLYPF